MRIGTEIERNISAGSRRASGEGHIYWTGRSYQQTMEDSSAAWVSNGSRLQQLSESGGEKDKEGQETGAGKEVRSEAEKIYQAAVSGKGNPIKELRTKPKVPYEHLAQDGVIEYNGVCFVCDEDTNSICLGDMTDKKNVLTIALSGGGHLKVNRNNLGDLSRAVGMFSPEDLNLIMRAIAQDTKIQSMKKEIEDEEASVGGSLDGEEVSETAGDNALAEMEAAVQGDDPDKEN